MNPKTVDEVITDFRGRRSAIVKALTQDVDQFYQLCLLTSNTPNNLCLYGFPDQHWDVNLPPNSELPHLSLGTNFNVHSMNRDDWLSVVALHSEAWLHAVASYFAAKFKFSTPDRKRLFEIIMEFPSINSVLTVNTTKSATKRKRVPEELLILILARLPVKDLVRYRSVCKSFRALIDHPEFVIYHLDTYKKNRDESNLLVIEEFYFKKEQVMVRSSDNFKKVMKLNYPIRDARYAREMGYINGLMLLYAKSLHRSDSVELILWNPSINKFVNIPCSSLLRKGNIESHFWLGYDASCNEYKVIAVVYPWPDISNRELPCQEIDPGLIQVYALSTNSWTAKSCAHPPFRWIEHGSQAYVNGAMHWINKGPEVQYVSGCKVGNSNLIVFDVNKEVFSYMEYPNHINMEYRVCDKDPISFGGLLGIFCTYCDDSHDVWVMEQYGVVHSWTKRYTFNFHLRNPRYLKSNGELLFYHFHDRAGVRSYDTKKELEREVAKTVFNVSSSNKICCFVESLVLQQSFK